MANWTVQYSYVSRFENTEISDGGTADLLIFFHRKQIKQCPLHLNALKWNEALTPLRSPGEANKEPKHKKQVFFSARQEYRRLSEQVVAALGGVKNYYALHVRRGDRAILSPELDRATQAGAIIERVQTMVPRGETVFLLSDENCLLYTSPSPRDRQKSRMPSSA